MPKMRLGWYAGVSTALAASVCVSAFHQRANFYSAMVYLSQSNFCLLALVNFTLLVYGAFIWALCKLCFGTLRAVEVEQLTERAWFAITETCLAMTIFRDEIGAWFIVMFTILVTGKVWGWIGDGRVEFLEQQPPNNPRLFHTRLSISLAISFIYDVWILRYCIKSVIQQARPTMMVMFLFEFAVLAVCSWRTGVRYILSLVEQRITHNQTNARLQARRAELRQEREQEVRRRDILTRAGEEVDLSQPLPSEDDVDEMDIEVPGWAAKGEWVLWLDLITDMFKLAIYVAFFFMLLIFYGLPIHIMRDLLLTARDFVKRLNAILRYRKAIQEMNRYPDATEADLQQENTCIICREEMRAWDANNNAGAIDRVRPKKLGCGHILHLGCLKSWLERQQVCPTCRAPVSQTTANNANQNNNNNAADNANQPGRFGNLGAGPQAPGGAGGAGANANQQGRNQNGGARIYNLGPVRVGFGAGMDQVRDVAEQLGIPPPVGNQPGQPGAANAAGTLQPVEGSGPADNIHHINEALQHVSVMVQHEVQQIQASQQELQTIELLLAELNRIRLRRGQIGQGLAAQGTSTSVATPTQPTPTQPVPTGTANINTVQAPTAIPPNLSAVRNHPGLVRHGVAPNTVPIPSGSPDLPDGLAIPQGWSVLPLQRMEGPPTAGHSSRAQSRGPSVSPNRGPESSLRNEVKPTPTATRPGRSLTPSLKAQIENMCNQLGIPPKEELQAMMADETAPKSSTSATEGKQSSSAASASTTAKAKAPAGESSTEPSTTGPSRPVYGPPRPPAEQTPLQRAVQNYLKSTPSESLNKDINSGMTVGEFFRKAPSPSDFPEGELRDFFFPKGKRPGQQESGTTRKASSSSAAAGTPARSASGSSSVTTGSNTGADKDAKKKGKAVTLEDLASASDEE